MELTLRDPEVGSPEAPGAAERRPPIVAQLWQRRRTVVGVFCATVLLTLALLVVLPVSYSATGSVIVADRESLVGTQSAAAVQKVGDPADMESNILLIRSPRLLRKMLADGGMEEVVLADCRAAARQLLARLRPINCDRLAGDAEAQLLWVQDRFSVGAVGRSRVISVSYRSALPEAAQAFVNALIRTFLDDERGKMLRSRDEATGYVRDRLRQVDAELRRDEAAIEDYRSAHGLVRGVSGPLAAERLTQAAQQLSEAKAGEAEAVLRAQEAQGGAASRQALESRPISDLKQQLATARAQAASAAQRFGPRNPDLVAIKRQEAELASQLAVEVARIGDSARRNLDAARARVAASTRELALRTDAANKAAEAETQIAAMVREQEIKRGTFVDLSQRLSQLETERRILEPNTQLVNLAELPSRPAFPQKLPFLVGGLTLAGVLGVASGLMTAKASPSTALALSPSYTRVPILAHVPELRLGRAARKEGGRREAARRRDVPLASAVALLDSHAPLLESIRVLYARLTLAGFGTRRRTLLVTSEVPGEGKTFVTLALARLARASGRRVLVVEGAVRQPVMEEVLGGPPSPGLGGFLMGGPLDVVQLAAVPGVDFLLGGDPLPTSTELLSGARFAELLARATDYDLVLVDSTAVSALMDAALIAPHVEGVLFCLRSGRPPMTHGLNSLPEMQRDCGNVVGLALTFVPDDQASITQLPPQGRAQLGRAVPQDAMEERDA